MFLKSVTALGILFISSEIAWQLWKRRYRRQLMAMNEELISDVLLFNNESSHCRGHAVSRISCSDKCPVGHVKTIVQHLDASKETLNVCMYIITCQDITDAIIRAKKRNVEVRMIVDASMTENSACSDAIKRIRRSGIKVLTRQSTTSLMHHKLAIIDEKVMIYGSTNWTMQAFYGNHDGIIITNLERLVQPFVVEFNRMWKDMRQLPAPIA